MLEINSYKKPEDVLNSYLKLDPIKYITKDHWHMLRYGRSPLVAIYIPRFHLTSELTCFDYEYIYRNLAVIKTIENLKALKDPEVDIYISTEKSDLPEDFYADFPSIIIEPTDLNFSVVHKGEGVVEILFKSQKPHILSNIWSHEDLLTQIYDVIWGIINITHKYYPVSRGNDIIFRDVFIRGAIIIGVEHIRIEPEGDVKLDLRLLIPPEATEETIKSELGNRLKSYKDKIEIIDIKITEPAVHIHPDKKIHEIATRAYLETFKKEPEYEWFPFPTVFNRLARTNTSLLAVGPYSPISLDMCDRKLFVDSNLLELFTLFLTKTILNLLNS